MKEIHYQNLGYPKTGTTWIYHQLLYHPQVDCQPDPNQKEFNPPNKELYLNFYKKYNVSFNLRTHTFLKPETLYYATHLTFIFRNPFHLLNTWYNFLCYANQDFKLSVEEFLKYDDYNFQLVTDTQRIFDNWKNYDVKWLFYDDLAADNKIFMYNLCDYLGLNRYFDPRVKPKFKTKITKEIVIDDEKLIKYINEKISIIEDHTKRDLTHWKK